MHRQRRRIRKALAFFARALQPGVTPAFTAPGPHAAPAVAAEKFQQVSLAQGAAEYGEPIRLAVLPNRSVLHTSRDVFDGADTGSLHEPDSFTLATG